MTAPTGFRARFLAGDRLTGTFCKIPTTHPIEMLGALGFEFVVIDEEHAPWDRVTIDAAILAARASGTAPIVRVSESTPSRILSVLDDGAAGVLAPHVLSAERAREIASAVRYRGGRRGFSNTTRAGGFGADGLWEHVDKSDAAATFIAMIEDPEAIEVIDDILAVEGLDGVFIGRGDLSVAMGASGPAAPEITAACETIIAAARRAGKPVAVLVSGPEETARFKAMGVTAFIISSDQGFLRQAAMRAYADVLAASA